MKKIFIAYAFAMLSFGSMFAASQFKGLNNKNGKTTVKIEIPDSDLSQFTVIRDWKLHNGGKTYDVRNVNVQGKEGNTFVLEFSKLTKFSDCRLSFTINGEPISIDIQSILVNR